MEPVVREFVFIFLISFLFTQLNFSQSNKVYVGHIETGIDLGLSPYIKRIINEAEKADAKAIIFKINTLGGRVDAAIQIKDAILSTNILTIAFVNYRAISAGALIALSCNKVVMAPGATIGAATVVDQAGKKVGEKYQSFMRSEMRTIAEKNGRRKDIAQGMVDEKVMIKGLVDSTQLITLTTEEALKYGIADTTVTDFNSLLKVFNLQDASIIDVESNWAEDVVKFLNNPIITSILIMIGFFGLFAEIKTPGWGVPGTAGIIALILFFGSSYILALASIIDIVLFIVGLVLIALEIFVIPGFGIAGISGIIMVIISLFLALTGTSLPYIDSSIISIALFQLSVSLVGALLLIFILAKFLPKTIIFNRLVLSEAEKTNKGFVSADKISKIIGRKGVALTMLRPAGIAEIEGKRIDVVTEGGYIEKGEKIIVISSEGIKVVVAKAGK
ncbi:MAG: nodulation protein NfeD [Bacteroidetes bacterium]|nr:nodulation protein NfeD [Bacteroidota bacterium]